jgi:hypothetical protein
MAPEDHDCQNVFQIKPISNNWHDIKSFKIEAEPDDKVFPPWFDKSKSFLDGCNTVLFNRYFKSFIGIKYRCFDFTFTEKQIKADKVYYEKHCLEEKTKFLDLSGYNYEYALPQNLLQYRSFEGPLSFSAFEKVMAVSEDSNASEFRKYLDDHLNPRSNLYKFTIIRAHNHNKGFLLQFLLLTDSAVSKTAMYDYKSIIDSVSFPKF